MLKIRKYYKPFMISILLAILLLFTQAMCDLKLPDYMSDIVNIGIQSNGIEQVAPEVISEKAYQLMKIFMEEQDKSYVDEKYTLVNQEDIDYIEEYPIVQNESIYVLDSNLEREEIEKLNNIFAISSRTMINVMTEATKEAGNDMVETDNTENLDFSQIYEILPILEMLPNDVIETAREQALQLPDTTLKSIGLVFTKSFYEEVRNEYFENSKSIYCRNWFKDAWRLCNWNYSSNFCRIFRC